MNLFRKYLSGFLTLFFSGTSFGAPLGQIQSLYKRMEVENADLKISAFMKDYKEENLTIARSIMYPGLSLTTGANKAKELTVRSSDFKDSSGNSVSTQATTLGLPSTFTKSVEGWSLQLSTTYYIFAHFAGIRGIDSAKVEIDSSSLSLNRDKLTKRSQLLQALMEWQWLHSLQPPLEDATKIMSRIKAHARTTSDLLYSANDEVELQEKDTELQLNAVKVNQGLKISESVIKDLLPSMTREELSRLPKIAIEYELPKEETDLKEEYIKKSVSRKIQENDVLVADNNYFVAKWKRPWVPTVALNGSLSRSGPYKDGDPENNWSAGVVATFGLFDGFYTDARRAQTYLSLQSAELKRDVETNKKKIFLEVSMMKAQVAHSEFKLKEVIARKKYLSMIDVRNKKASGIGTDVEVSLTSLAYVKAKADELQSLKDYQATSLSIAVEFNEWDKVKVYETNQN